MDTMVVAANPFFPQITIIQNMVHNRQNHPKMENTYDFIQRLHKNKIKLVEVCRTKRKYYYRKAQNKNPLVVVIMIIILKRVKPGVIKQLI